MSLFDGTSPWPRWLWILSALWITALIFWQPTENTRRERWGWGALALVYAVLIVLGGRIAPDATSDEPRDSWLLGIGLLLFLGGAVTSMGLRTLLWQKIAYALTALGAGLTLAMLQAPEAALACGVMSLSLARRTAVVTASDPAGALPRQNVWLAGVAAVVTLVVTLGLVRQALITESSRIGPSRWQTVFPTRAQVARHQMSDGSQRSSLPVEAWGLATVCLLAAWTRTVTLPREDVLSETISS